MTHDEEQAALSRAATLTRRRILRDCAEATGTVRRLLKHLETRFLDPELNACRWMEQCRVTSNSTEQEFHAQVGVPPAFYLWDLRMEICARLLQDTNFSIERIAMLLGFSGAQYLRKAFRRWSGLPPRVYRKGIRETIEKAGLPPENFNSSRYLRTVFSGGLDPPEAIELFEHLQNLTEVSREPAQCQQPAGTIMEDSKFDRLAAIELWEKIKQREFSVQGTIVRSQLHIDPFFLSEFLCHKSLKESRKDRQRGVEVAQLALAALDRRFEDVGQDLPNHLAQGWVCMANAQWLAGNSASAEVAIEHARLALVEAGTHGNPAIKAHVDAHEAHIRWYQRRYEEGLHLVECAIPSFRKLGENADLARCLIVRGCIRRDLAAVDNGISDFSAAADLIDQEAQPYLALSAQTGLAYAYGLAGRYREAEEALVQAEGLCEQIDCSTARLQVLWTKGLVKQQRGDLSVAEVLLREARVGLATAGEAGYSGVVSVDLAILYSEENRPADAIQVAAEALPLLKAMDLQTEGLAAVRLLSDGIESQEIPLAVLKKLRRCLAELQGIFCS